MVCAVTAAKGVSGSGESMVAIAVLVVSPSYVMSENTIVLESTGRREMAGRESFVLRRRVKKIAACRKAVLNV